MSVDTLPTPEDEPSARTDAGQDAAVPTPTVAELRARITADLMIRDAARLGRSLEGTRRVRPASRRQARLRRISDEIDVAAARAASRRASIPSLRRPPELPISDRADELVALLAAHQVVVVAGETGSGKSTQLPKLCLEAGFGVRGLIGHTQPRRIAARAVAERVAEEVGTTVGELIGYTVRFTDAVSPRTLVKVMTDGILLNELQRDPELSAYEVLIIDEAHERGLNIDFILGYLRQLLPRRPDLHVVITSATIDTARFAAHFADEDGDPAPVIEVSGRTYPVEVRHRPLAEEATDGRAVERDLVDGICDAVEELIAEGPGDILVFASGERDIADAADALTRRRLADTEVLPLYARLSAAEQHRVFAPHRGRRIVIATNIAETSLTVPGIRYVVDPGLARVSRYSRRTKVQRLPIEKISQASADQRAGRCGRLGPGVAIRLYDEDDLAARSAFTEPEVLRTNLASVILQMTAIGLGDVAAFPFVDRPDARQVADGVALLEELGAVVDAPEAPGGRALTEIGRALARLPIDPRLGRMVLAAADEGCVHEVMVIAAALSIQDPRERPREAAHAAAAAHAVHVEEGSDLLTLVNLWDHVRTLQRQLSSSAFRRRCRQEFLHHLRVREWQDVHGQIRGVCAELGLPMSRDPDDPMAVHRAVLAGLLSNIGLRDGASREYLGTRGTRFVLGSRSALSEDPPGWVVAAELVETNRIYAGMAATIRPRWVEELAPHLVTRAHDEPEWDARRGAAVVEERVSFRGIPLSAGRRVPLAPIDPAAARRMFLDHALGAGEWGEQHAFADGNAARVAEVRRLEERLRRPGLMAPEDVVADHYDAVVPPDVVDARSFGRWWQTARTTEPHLLDVGVEQLLSGGQEALADLAHYPDRWTSPDGTLDLPLDYTFAPDDPDIDGVTIDIPLALLPRLQPGDFDWQVPGLRYDLVVALIRALPKPLRRGLVPAPDTARAVLQRVGPADGPLLPVLAREFSRISGALVTPESWAGTRLPDHLRMRYRVIGDVGTLATGSDLGTLKRGVEAHLHEAVRQATPVPTRTGLTDWTIGTLEREIRGSGGGVEVIAYPALVDEGDTVGVRAFPTAAAQQRAMAAGTRRLLRRGLANPVQLVSRQLSAADKLALTFAPHADVAAVIEDCTACVIDALVEDAGGPAWDEEAFTRLRASVRDRSPRLVVVTATATAGIVRLAQQVREALGQPLPGELADARSDIARQLGRLVYPGFVAASGGAHLGDLQRYLQGMLLRLRAMGRNPTRDAEAMAVVRDLEEELATLRRMRGEALDAVAADRIRWMLEELRISLFAQALGTSGKVSEARVRKAIAELRVGWSGQR